MNETLGTLFLGLGGLCILVMTMVIAEWDTNQVDLDELAYRILCNTEKKQ